MQVPIAIGIVGLLTKFYLSKVVQWTMKQGENPIRFYYPKNLVKMVCWCVIDKTKIKLYFCRKSKKNEYSGRKVRINENDTGYR